MLGACSDTRAPIVIALPEIAAAGSAEPNLSRAADGTIILSWLEPLGDGVALRYSVLDDSDWSTPITISSGDDWFVNWADFPSVVKIGGELWAAHWLAKRPGGTFAYDVAVSLSHDGGQTWGEPITPHTDNTPTEHGFVSLFPWQDGVGALWLDGRNMSGHGKGGMTLRSAVIDAESELAFEQLADEMVCDCCQTDVTVGPEGPVAVYRNRTEEEIRDIYVMRAIKGKWQPGSPVYEDGWKITGCPVNGPAITSNGEALAVAWFTAADETPKVRFARSADGGVSFENPLDVALTRPAGRVGVALADDGSATVSWLRVGADSKGEIVIRNVSHDGELGEERLIATTNAGRMSGFPQLVRDNDNLVLAWTDTLGKTTRVRSALLKTSL